MNAPLILASSLLVVVLALALAREVRIRRALQRLLARVLTLWRNQHAEKFPENDPDRSDSGDHRL